MNKIILRDEVAALSSRSCFAWPPMKTLITAATLLVLTSPVLATDDPDLRRWDCPHGVVVTQQEDDTFSASPPTKKKITRIWDFGAEGPDYEIRLGNRVCKYRFKPGSRS